MTDLLLQIAVGNLLLSVPLALLAYTVHQSQRLPVLAHLLWVLVLVKLVTPPLMTIPLVPIPAAGTMAVSTSTHGTGTPLPINNDVAVSTIRSPGAADLPSRTHDRPESGDSWTAVKRGIIAIWITGGVVVLIRSLLPVVAFKRRLRRACRCATPDVQRLAAETARRFGLRSCPVVYTVSAQLSPLVWWIGGHVRIVIPGAIAQEMRPDDLKLILAHELAHIKRRDHLIRWIEWLACMSFWWNPMAWWARRNLRLNEEICCDAMVLKVLNPDPRSYARSLMKIVEFLAFPAIRPPVVACAMNNGGSLERRFQMILSMKTTTKATRRLSAGVLTVAMGLLPFGIAYGQDYVAVERRLGAAVAEGEITVSQAHAMMSTLRATAAREGVARRIREIEAAVKAGKMSREEGAHAIEATRRAMAEAAGDQGGDVPRRAFMHRIGEIEEAVKADKMSREEGARAIEATRRAMAEAAGDQGGDVPRKAFMHRIREIEEAVKADKMSREEGAHAIEATRRAMEGAARDVRGDAQSDLGRKMQEVVRIVEAYEAELMKDVEAGRMSKEEFGQKLVAYSGEVMSRILQNGERRDGDTEARR